MSACRRQHQKSRGQPEQRHADQGAQQHVESGFTWHGTDIQVLVTAQVGMLAWTGGSKKRLRSHLHKKPKVLGITNAGDISQPAMMKASHGPKGAQLRASFVMRSSGPVHKCMPAQIIARHDGNSSCSASGCEGMPWACVTCEDGKHMPCGAAQHVHAIEPCLCSCACSWHRLTYGLSCMQVLRKRTSVPRLTLKAANKRCASMLQANMWKVRWT